MNTLRNGLTLALVSALSVTGCFDKAADETVSDVEEITSPEPSAADASVRLEQAERALDAGRDIEKAILTLTEITRETTICSDIRDRATMSLSRAYELQNDKEHAISAIEALLVSHVDDHSWPGSSAADKRLRLLLTGTEAHKDVLRSRTENVSPFARALAQFFPAKKDAATEVSILAFGGDSDVSDKQGTFQIAAAIRGKAEEACPLCDSKVNVHTSSSRTDSWTSIPAAKDKMANSLAVFYTHLGDPIPSRYDSLLPLKMEEVIAHLEKGEGVIAAKMRKDAPPLLLIAAPREAQLAEVESILAYRSELPVGKEVVKVTPNLKPHEIQGQVRLQMPAFRACYESLLARSPGATGKVTLAFVIPGDGSISDLNLTTEGTNFDGSMSRCVTEVASKLRFAKTGVSTTIKYPISFTP